MGNTMPLSRNMLQAVDESPQKPMAAASSLSFERLKTTKWEAIA
jgi:hypothetical protein